MTPAPARLAATAALALVATAAFTGCVAKADPAASGSAAAGAVTVTSTDTTCEVSQATATSGTLDFAVKNTGSQITEFYLLAEDGLQIVGEIENVAPGASRNLTVVAQPGNYFTLCKPGMLGAGVGKAAFAVSGKAVAETGADAEQKAKSVALYAAFVKNQVEELLPATKTFVAAYESGDDAAAREQFPRVRAYYERIEPVAEALGTLDPRIDYREVDAVAEGLDWTGFHRIEKDLWVPKKDALNSDGETSAYKNWEPSTPAQRAEFGKKLIADVTELYTYVHTTQFVDALEKQGVAGISNGAIGLLNEVATGKISGEEDWWSGTDLWDFAANVEGSKMAFSLVKNFAEAKDAEGKALATKITAGYAALDKALAEYGSFEKGFVNYRELTEADKRQLTDLINALAEPLSQLTSTILK